VTTNPGHADRVIRHYSVLARTVLAGKSITDFEPGALVEEGFGAGAYAGQSGVPESALRASMGCGNPVAIAGIRPADTVLDLGSGGGLDVLLAARETGSGGVAYGLDASADMLSLARVNAAAAGVANAVFLAGRMEDIPLPSNHADVVISNGVINLSADKPRVLAEAYRVLKPGGRLGICDVISDEGIDQDGTGDVEPGIWYTAGTLTEARYSALLQTTGFAMVNITITGDVGNGLHSAVIQAVRPGS
jgi:arsenite methyltransferase